MSTKTSRLALLGATGAILLAALTACSAPSSSGAPDVSDSKGPDSSASQNQTADQAFDAWRLELAQCMRDEGFDMPDGTDESATLSIPEGQEAAWNTASEKCRTKVGPAPSRDGRSADQVQQDALKLAQCIRDEGYDYKDPEPGEGARAVRDDIPMEVFEKCDPTQAK